MDRIRFDIKLDLKNKIFDPIVPVITKYSVEDLIFTELCRIDPFMEDRKVWRDTKDFFGL